MRPYYEDGFTTLYFGDCREVEAWRWADVLVTDPPYGTSWSQHGGGRLGNGRGVGRRPGIAGDGDTSLRDEVMAMWGDRPAVVFGSFTAAAPAGVRHVAVYQKATNAGVLGATVGLRRDVEAIWLTGLWPTVPAVRGSVFATASTAGSPNSPQQSTGHPHTKPLDVLEPLVRMCPPGMVADPFAGSGSTLVAARLAGRRSIGVELEERWCEVIAHRLAQDVLPVEMHSRESP